MTDYIGKAGAGDLKKSASERNSSISLIRAIALVFIITCHILQKLDSELAWWFNVGVQMFLCISGYLYGQKEVGEVTSFFSRRLKKILIPYYIVFIPYGVLQFLFAKDVFNFKQFIKGLFVNATLKGAGHLWFVHTILICYLMVPLLTAYRDKYLKSKKHFLLFSFLSIEIAVLFFKYFNTFYNPAWISCFITGYALGINEKKGFISRKIILAAFGVLSAAGNGIQIYCSYIAHVRFARYEEFCDSNHVFLGVFLFLMLKSIFDRIRTYRVSRFLSFADRYSYEMYLAHHLIILGPFSLMNLTGIVWLNIVIILALSIILADAVKRCSEIIDRFIFARKTSTK